MLIDPIPMNKPDQFVDELDQSILGRTTEFDGIQITGGYANHLTPEDTLRHPVDTLNRTATDGYLMDFGTVMTDTVLRFTSFAPSGTNSYTEDGYDKTIYLTQYDNREGGTGASLNFTTQENMGSYPDGYAERPRDGSIPYPVLRPE